MARREWWGLPVAVAAAVVAVVLLITSGAVHAQGANLRARAYGLRAFPPLPADAGDRRLLPAPTPGVGSAYAFEQTLPDGLPVTYDPCRPLHYVIRSTRLPAYGAAMVKAAVARVQAATGLEFVFDGYTTEAPSTDRPLVQSRYGDRWAPLLIAFSDPSESPSLGGDVMGRGGSAAVAPDGPASARYVTGQVILDLGDFQTVMSRPDGTLMARASIMHELGHVVGMAHVQNTDQIMDPVNGGTTTWGSGDLHGLALLGSGLCHHDM